MLFTSRPALLQVIRISGFVALGLAVFLSIVVVDIGAELDADDPLAFGNVMLLAVLTPLVVYGFRYAYLTCWRLRPLSVQHFVGAIAGLVAIGSRCLYWSPELEVNDAGGSLRKYLYPATVILCWLGYRIAYPRLLRYLFPEPPAGEPAAQPDPARF